MFAFYIDRARDILKRRLGLYSIILILISILVLGIELLVPGIIKIDGPYIYFRYAQNLLDGYGFTWNRNFHPSYGITSVAYVYVVAFFRILMPDTSPSGVLTTASSIIGFLTLPFIPFLINKIVGDLDFKKLFLAGLTIPYLIFFGSYTFHSLNGLETILSFTGNLFFIYTVYNAARLQTTRAIFTATVSAFIIYFIRSDNAIYMFLFPYLIFYYAFEVDRKTVKLFYGYLIFFVLVDVIIKYYYFHLIVPLTLFVRLSGYSQKFLSSAEWNTIEYVRIFLINALPFIIILLFTYSSSKKKILLPFIIPLLLTCFCFFFFIHNNGYQARYFFPSLPFIIVPAFLSLFKFMDDEEKIVKFKEKNYYIIGLVVVLIISAFIIEPFYSNSLAKSSSEYNLNKKEKIKLPLIGNWEAGEKFSDYLKKFPKNMKIAAGEPGYIGAYNPGLRIIDLTGNQDKEIAINHEIIDYLIKEKPVMIWMPEWSNRGLNNELLMSKKFHDNYIFIPGAFNYGLAISRENPTLAKSILSDLRNIYRRD
ncbi:MAG TPA: hypothetical protein VFF33_03975 [Ignavibacteriaceae bacterium]|nr:hypothetical protein [Ignavibacteriaceae bacterium]